MLAAVQLAALAVLVTALFTGSGVLGVLPGPAAVGELAALVADAATQIRTGVAPVPATPAMLLLVTVAFGVTAVAVHAIAVGAGAPAAAGVLLLAVFAVPAALADELLPGVDRSPRPPPVSGCCCSPGPVRRPAGRRGARARAPSWSSRPRSSWPSGWAPRPAGVGTAGRFPSAGGAGAGRVGEIGLSPFTSLRGAAAAERAGRAVPGPGLPRPAYLRALTLSSYVPDAGWQATRPGPGPPLTGPLPGSDVPGDRASVDVENVGFRDYWLPAVRRPAQRVRAARGPVELRRAQRHRLQRPARGEDGWTAGGAAPCRRPGAAGGRRRRGGVDPAFLDTRRRRPAGAPRSPGR